MRDETHVGLVDPHAEGDRRDHDDPVVAEEAHLVRAARRCVHAGVIGERIDAVFDQPLHGVVHFCARGAVDDAGFALVSGEEGEQLAARVAFLHDAIADVRAVEARDEAACGAEGKPFAISARVSASAVAVSAMRGM